MRSAVRRTAAGLVSVLILGGTSPASTFDRSATTYVRERAYAEWVVPTRTRGHVVVYVVAGATYEDLEAGTTLRYAEVTRSRCVVNEEGRECGTPRVEEYATPKLFDVADDLSKANLTLDVRRASVSVDWVAHPPDRNAEAFFPLSAEYEESCPEGTGQGRGVFRRMQVSGNVLGERFKRSSRALVRAWVDRAVIRTDCHRDASASSAGVEYGGTT